MTPLPGGDGEKLEVNKRQPLIGTRVDTPKEKVTVASVSLRYKPTLKEKEIYQLGTSAEFIERMNQQSGPIHTKILIRFIKSLDAHIANFSSHFSELKY